MLVVGSIVKPNIKHKTKDFYLIIEDVYNYKFKISVLNIPDVIFHRLVDKNEIELYSTILNEGYYV